MIEPIKELTYQVSLLNFYINKLEASKHWIISTTISRKML